ncbi:MAG: tetratricopeptide repeat protein [Saprospiraceae bacterium]|nr:tetratricopeptide repeat protein [Saprospiraceae bacterium]
MYARCCFFSRNIESAIDNFKEYAVISKKYYGPNHINIAYSHKSLGNCYFSKGEYTEAEKEYKQAINMYLKTNTNKNDLSSIYNLLGKMNSNIGILDSAVKNFNLSIQYCEQAYSPTSPNCIRFKLGLAKAYSDFEKLSEANMIYRTIIAQAEREDLNTLDFAGVYTGWARNLLDMGFPDSSIHLLDKALSIQYQLFGKEITEMGHTYALMGLCYSEKSNFENALIFHRKSLENRARFEGKKSINYAMSQENIGSVYYYLGNFSKALEHYYISLEIQEKTYAIDNPDFAKTINNIGEALYASGKVDESIKFHNRALQIRLKKLGKDNLETAQSLNNLGKCHTKKGLYADAIMYLKEAEEIAEINFGPTHPDVSKYLNSLGNCYKDMGEYIEATVYFERALNILRNNYSDLHLNTVIAMCNLAKLEAITGNNIGAFAKIDSLYNNICVNNNFNKYNYEMILPILEARTIFLRTRTERLVGNTKEDDEIELLNVLLKRKNILKNQLNSLNDMARIVKTKELAAVSEEIIGVLHKKNRKDIGLCLDISENIKAELLSKAMRESNALLFAKIPDFILQKEKT